MPTPPPTVPIDDSNQGGLYSDYRDDFAYTFAPGVVVTPCADGAPLAVRVHKPYSVRTQTFNVRKKNNPPVVPGPMNSSQSGGDVLISQVVSVPMPSPSGTNPPTWNWTVSGQYTYLEATPHVVGLPDGLTPGQNPPEFTRGFRTGRMPFTMPALAAGQTSQGGTSDATLRTLLPLGALVGGLAFAEPVIAEITPQFDTGAYVWMFGSILPNAFFDPTLG